ncbi:MAG TPA: hypothetical protein VFS32_14680 [Candidatus Limnocylindrales bacterium]|nr:hypothetical protein [Candidatus Limnocylindrales bacterium]
MRPGGDEPVAGTEEPVAPIERPTPLLVDPGATAESSPIDSPAGEPATQPHAAAPASRAGATPAQLRRFIKSRPYVPLHELRRRFGLNGHEDDVVCIDLPERRVWVGLPADEGRMLAELVRQGEVGCELSIDPASPVVVGVFPIRPVALGRSAPPAPPADQQAGSLPTG